MALRFELAAVGLRFRALILDFLILGFSVFVLVIAVSIAGISGLYTPILYAISTVLIFVALNFYYIISELRWQGRTIGKRWAKIRVVARDGGPLTAGLIFARNLTRNLEFMVPMGILISGGGLMQIAAFLWLVIVFAMPLVSKHNLRLGDLIAGTIVVHNPVPVLMRDVATHPARHSAAGIHEESRAFSFTKHQLDIYGIRELQVLEDLLRKYPVEVDRDTLITVAEAVKKKIGWPRTEWNVDPVVFLQDFYAAQRADLEKAQLFGRARESKRT